MNNRGRIIQLPPPKLPRGQFAENRFEALFVEQERLLRRLARKQSTDIAYH